MLTIAAARRRTLPVLSAALMLTGAAACSSEPDRPRDGVSVEELTGDVSGDISFDTAEVANRITLKGTIVRVLSPDSFELTAADGASETPVLVLNREDDLTEGQVVQVIGTVRLFDHEEYAEDYQLADPSAYGTNSGQRFILASEVDTDVPGDDQ